MIAEASKPPLAHFYLNLFTSRFVSYTAFTLFGRAWIFAAPSKDLFTGTVTQSFVQYSVVSVLPFLFLSTSPRISLWCFKYPILWFFRGEHRCRYFFLSSSSSSGFPSSFSCLICSNASCSSSVLFPSSSFLWWVVPSSFLPSFLTWLI